MKKLCVFAVLCAVAIPAMAQDKALEDWSRMNDLLAVYNSNFGSAYSQSDKGPEFIQLWKDWSKDAAEFIPYFKKTYGDTPEAVASAFEGKEPPEGVHNYPRALTDALYAVDVQALQAEVAGWLAKAGDEQYAKWDGYDAPPEKAELKLKYAERALAAYEGAAEISPEAVGDQIAKAEKAVEESEAVAREALESKEWPGHNPEFAGPGDPDDLAAAALKLLERLRKEDRTWSKPEYDDEHIPLAACVVATAWGVEKKTPITEIPTQRRLKMFVAFGGTKDDDVAYGYYMYFYTPEKEGIEEKPPFEYCNSEQYACFKLLKEKITEGGGAAISDEGAKEIPGASGGTGVVRRFILSLVLVAAGLAASSGSVLGAKFAFLKPSCTALGARRIQAGAAVLAMGALTFLLTLVRFAIFTDLLPQAVAIALGLALLHVGGTDAKAASPLGKASAAVAPFEKPLGLAAVVLGVLHLLIGGVGLF
ncbi:MAG: hypothetical protein GY851_10910 [bacterium]|nr:hypothetical protein [bacterium]